MGAENIAGYKSLPEGTFVKITLRDALVTYSEVHQVKGDIYGHTYIQDDSGAMGIVGWGGTPLKTNEILNGHLYGYGTGTDMFSSCQYTSFDNLVTGTLPVAPKEIGSIDEMLNDDNLSSIVSLDGVTLYGGYARKDGTAVKYIYAPTVSAPAARVSTRAARAASGDTYCITGILQKEQGGIPTDATVCTRRHGHRCRICGQ